MTVESSGTTWAFIIPIIALIVIFFTVAVTVGIGVYVYRDARRRDMNAALWTLVCLIAPGLIGLIIYLIVRSDREIKSTSCPSCGAKVDESFRLCPYCLHVLKPQCPTCAQPLGAGWYSCPTCGEPIPDEMRVPLASSEYGKDRGLTVILLGVIIVPIMLVIVAVAAFFMLTGRSIVSGDDNVYLQEESISIDEDEIIIDVRVSVSEDVDSVYSALITYYSNGDSVESSGVSNADGTRLDGEIHFASVMYDGIDECMIEFYDKNGNVVAESGMIKCADGAFVEGALYYNASSGTIEFEY